MAVLRRCALAVLAVALAGCHEEPQVILVPTLPSGGPLGLTATGGTANGTGAVGGAGGNLLISSWQEASVGVSDFLPTAPTAPTAPTTGTTITTADLAADYPPSGSVGTILIANGSVTAGGSGTTRKVTSTFGDIVVQGSLSAGDGAGAPQSIELDAPNGTVYVLGTLSTRNTDGTLDGDAAGAVTIKAQRIVITGTIDARGEDNSAGAGGDGGVVTLDATGGSDILFLTTASILTTGGASTAPGPGPLTGSRGGGTALTDGVSITAGNVASVFGLINTDGGAVTGSGTMTGGPGGSVSINAGGGVDIVASVSSQGGSATGDTATTVGGAGAAFVTNSRVRTRVYGSIITAGGSATATSGTITGGTGGDITLGRTFGGGAVGAQTLEVGRSTYSTSGGPGTGGGGKAGTVEIRSEQNRVSLGSPVAARGGDATGSVDAPGGDGNTVTVLNNSFANAVDSESAFILNTATIDTSGGLPVGAQAGGKGFDVTVTASAMAQVMGPVITRGADSPTGIGGAGGALSVTAAPSVSTDTSIFLSSSVDTRGGNSGGTGAGGKSGNVTVSSSGTTTRVDSSALFTCTGGSSVGGGGGDGGTFTVTSAGGAVTFTGTLNTSGGIDSGTAAGGSGGDVSFAATGGDLSVSLTLTASGGAGTGTGGTAGNLSFTTTGRGNVFLSGTMTSSGGNNATVAPKAGATVIVSTGATGGSITSSAVLSATGGSFTGAGGVSAANGGSVSMTVANSSGAITLDSGSSIVLDGGSTSGAGVAVFGGNGGTLTLTTVDQFISITGSILARGGSGTSGANGGQGGQVTANSDSDGGATPGGNITLQSGSAIDVSGGAGSIVGGSAQNNGLGTVTTPTAVSFIANTSGAPKGNEGIVVNLGSITATGASPIGSGGDIQFIGLGAGGVGTPSNTGINQSGAGGGPAGNFSGIN